MWTINGTNFISKAGNWKSEWNRIGNGMTEWNLIKNGTAVYIAEDGFFLGSFDSFNVIKESFNDAQKSWKQGEVDAEGYFKLTHLTSQKILTAIFPNKLILVDKGKSYILQGFSY